MKTICLAVLLLASSSASAAVQTYPDRASWLAAGGTPTGGENFNGFTQDVPTKGATVPIQGGTISTVDTTTNAPAIFTNRIDVFPFAFNTYFLDDTPYFLADVVLNRSTILQFDTPITAWAADFGRGHTPGLTAFPRIDLFDAAGALLGSVPINPDFVVPDEIQFYGFTITGGAASRLVLANSTSPGNRVYGIDNIQFVAVPEPTTLTLTVAASAILAIAGLRRRPA